MNQDLEKLAMEFAIAPTCKLCGKKMHFELWDTQRSHYTGRVRVSCECGGHGEWTDYPIYGISIPEMAERMNAVARAYMEGGASA